MTSPVNFGPYELRGLLGRGGMGEVFLAFDREQAREVALKLLPAELAGNAAFVRRFGEECHAVAQLTEPHVIPVHRFGAIDGRPFIDMRLVDGLDLAELLDRDGALPAGRAVGLVEQAARALDAAHRAGLLHRDVKPSNLLVAPHDFVYLVDFGLAEAIGAAHSDLPGERNTVGTPDYLAPERLVDGRETDVRADVYSLACVLFECLTGRPPFPLTRAADVVQAHLTRRPPRVSVLRDDLPESLDTVLARGMAKMPEARYASAGDLATAARLALSGSLPGAVVPARAGGAAGPGPDVGLDTLLGPGTAGLSAFPGPATRPVRRPGTGHRGTRVLAIAGAGAGLMLAGTVLGSTAFRPDSASQAGQPAPPATQPAPVTTVITASPSSAPVTPSPAAASVLETPSVTSPSSETLRSTAAPWSTRVVVPPPRTSRPPVPRRTVVPPPPPPTTTAPPAVAPSTAPSTTAPPSPTTTAPPPPPSTTEPAPPSTPPSTSEPPPSTSEAPTPPSPPTVPPGPPSFTRPGPIPPSEPIR